MRGKSVQFWETGRDGEPSPTTTTGQQRHQKLKVIHSKQEIVTQREIVAFCLCPCGPPPVPLRPPPVHLRPLPVPLQPLPGMRLKQGNHPLSNAANPHRSRTNKCEREEGRNGEAREYETEKEQEEGEETN